MKLPLQVDGYIQSKQGTYFILRENLGRKKWNWQTVANNSVFSSHDHESKLDISNHSMLKCVRIDVLPKPKQSNQEKQTTIISQLSQPRW